MHLASQGKEAKYLAVDAVDFIRQGEDAWDAAEETLEFFGARVVDGISFHLDAVKLLAPLANPSKVIGVGLNYGEHRSEQNIAADKTLYPILFPKFPSSIIGPGEAITWDPAMTQKVDYEGELGVVIGKRARRVSAADALEYVFGYCNLDDISARDLQYDEKGGRQYTRGKSLDTFCPMGPVRRIQRRDSRSAEPSHSKLGQRRSTAGFQYRQYDQQRRAVDRVYLARHHLDAGRRDCERNSLRRGTFPQPADLSETG